MKRCSKCRVLKPFTEFYKRLNGLQNHCKPCDKESHKIRNATPQGKLATKKANSSDKHKEAIKRIRSTAEYRAQQAVYRATAKSKDSRRKHKLKSRYGITVEQYDALMQAQNGVCAVCHDKKPTKPLSVDHDHSTGAVRGLLCDNCNLGIGNLQDSEFLLESALAYIRAHRKE